MQLDDIEKSAGIIGKLIAIAAALFGAWKFAVPKFRNYWITHCAASDISREFGAKAGAVLKASIVDLEKQKYYTQATIEALTKSSELGIYICDEQGLCVSINLVLEEWLGMSRDAAKGYGWLAAIVDQQKAHQMWVWSIKNGTPYRDEYQIRSLQTGEVISAKTETVKIGTEHPIHIGFVRKKDT
jgi:PAS domain-containing protein